MPRARDRAKGRRRAARRRCRATAPMATARPASAAVGPSASPTRATAETPGRRSDSPRSSVKSPRRKYAYCIQSGPVEPEALAQHVRAPPPWPDRRARAAPDRPGRRRSAKNTSEATTTTTASASATRASMGASTRRAMERVDAARRAHASARSVGRGVRDAVVRGVACRRRARARRSLRPPPPASGATGLHTRASPASATARDHVALQHAHLLRAVARAGRSSSDTAPRSSGATHSYSYTIAGGASSPRRQSAVVAAVARQKLRAVRAGDRRSS